MLSCIEDQRWTLIHNNTRASCYWHSIFAHACALIGHDVAPKHTKWRAQCASVFRKCDAGSVYEECPSSCINSCSDRDDENGLNSVCRQQCLAGKIKTPRWISTIEYISSQVVFVRRIISMIVIIRIEVKH